MPKLPSPLLSVNASKKSVDHEPPAELGMVTGIWVSVPSSATKKNSNPNSSRISPVKLTLQRRAFSMQHTSVATSSTLIGKVAPSQSDTIGLTDGVGVVDGSITIMDGVDDADGSTTILDGEGDGVAVSSHPGPLIWNRIS